ncbi:hypothetical protein KAJ61_05185 [Candidatus Parcubacteria bacterium]|nr:hypothetical protein [Candidatus Parcubacteria bacterium]
MLRKKITAYEMAMDFIATALAIAMSIFCFFYFILGNRMGLAEDLARFFAIVSVFGILFIYWAKVEKNKIKKNIRESSLDDIIVYFIKTDKIKNLAVIFLQILIILGIAFFNGVVNSIDGLQAFLFFSFSFLWHLYIFRKRDGSQIMYATNYDKTKDIIFIFFLPTLLLVTAICCKKIDIIDQAQALSVFLLQYIWHKYLIRKK